MLTQLAFCAQDADGKEIIQTKYVMKAGDLAKGLLLCGNLNMQLTALHTDKPKIHQVLSGKLNLYQLSCIGLTWDNWFNGKCFVFRC